ncbi:hypothetical protein BHM03_00047251 [Ensete ventricosum]|nr:hypothetical protein BHM03_00047251 [Ensete ventricosum]
MKLRRCCSLFWSCKLLIFLIRACIVHGKSAWHDLTCVCRIIRVGWGDLGWLGKNGERGDGEDKEGRNICRFPLPSVAPGLHLLSDSVPDGGLRRLQPASSTARPSRAGRGESRGGARTGPAAGWGVSSGSRRGGGARPDRGRAGRQPAGGGGVCLPSWAGMWWWSLPIPASSSASQETVSDGE